MRAVAGFSGRLAVAVAALATLAAGVGVGNAGIVAGVAGALAFGWGAGALDTDSNGRRALGSVATTVGGLLVLVGMATAGADVAAFVVSALALLGLSAVAVDATAGLGDETLAPLLASLGSSIATVIGGVALASLFHVAFGVGLAGLLLVGLAGVSLATPLGAFVVLQVQAVLVAVLMRRARSVVEGWFPGGVPVEAWEEFEPLAMSLREVPRAYWVALGLQVVLLFAGANAVVEWLLASTWLFGAVVDGVLRSGLVHGALLLVMALEATVLLAEFVRSAANSALAPNPPKSLSYATGGIALSVVVPVLVGVAALASGLLGLGIDPLILGGTWGSAAALLSLSVVALGVVFAVEVTAVAIAERSLLPERVPGFAMGATLLFLAAVGAAPAGAPPVVTFAGVAAALVAWDLGETSVDLGTHLGAADTRRAEVVHATGTVAVGVAGVVLAALSVHLLGPLRVPGAAGRAVAALGLSIVALLAFVLALDRRPDVE
jgi:hypothetical protein